MLLPKRLVKSLILVLTLPGPTLCQTYGLNAPSAGTQNGEIQINVNQTPKGGGAGIIPPFGALSNAGLWRVTVYRKVGDDLTVDVPEIVVNSVTHADDYARTGNVTLITSANYRLDPYTNAALTVEIHFLGGGAISTVMFSAPKSTGGDNSATTSASKSGGGSGTGCGAGPAPQQPGTSYTNYCFSGIWIPQVGSHPLYSTNSNFSLAQKLGPGSIGIRAQESADSSVVVDPNAFAAAIFYQAVLLNSTVVPHLMGVYLNWNLATVEFDRKKKNTNLGTNVNLVTAPEFVLPVSFGRIVGAELDAGVEAGHNFKNNINPNGFGTVLRGLLGAQAEKIFTPRRHLKALDKIKLSSQYQVRLLADDEVITRSVHGKLVPFEGHQARNWVSSEVDFMFTPNFGLTLKHDYGALPPGFVFVENRATIGVTIQSAQK